MTEENNKYLTCEYLNFTIDYFLSLPHTLVNSKDESLYSSLISEIEKKFNVQLNQQELQSLVDKACTELKHSPSIKYGKNTVHRWICLISLLKR